MGALLALLLALSACAQVVPEPPPARADAGTATAGNAPTPAPSPTGAPRFNVPTPGLLGSDLFKRQDLIFGTEIGAWPFGGKYDAYPLLHDATCQQLAREAGISVVRWLPWKRFTDLGGDLTDQAFNNVIDGIRRAGAMPFVKLPPGVDHQCEPHVDVKWLKEIIRRAGNRVVLYELTNEANYYCKWTPEYYAREWIQVVPQLKRYARSLGFEIYVGGPSWASPELEKITTFLRLVKEEYQRSGDADVVPDFVSFHTYASHSRHDSAEKIMREVATYGPFMAKLHEAIAAEFGFAVPIANTEWNFTVDLQDHRDENREFIANYTRTMLGLFREHRVWLANQFHFASGPATLDMVSETCRPKPMYEAFKAESLAQRAGERK